MAKSRTHFQCNECGASAGKWTGQCAECGAWNTLVETPVAGRSGSRNQRFASHRPTASVVRGLGDVRGGEKPRKSTGLAELDRAIGGGLVPGSVVLIGGDPGIGKSTLLIQVLAALSNGAH
ncbi:MAG: DNA repair protein RadA, partial [Gammaproteobacteria bacterium]|nr:DNA repair protein RadA [Gammaproteobacteria bacterium]